jgi:hypothetical protein
MMERKLPKMDSFQVKVDANQAEMKGMQQQIDAN